MEAVASWATATSRTSCCRRRSRPLLASASSLCRLERAQPRPHRRRRRLELGLWRLWPAGPRRPAGPAAAQEGRGLGWPARRRCVGWSVHSLALTADGAVWSWGDGGCGQLGHGDEQHQLLPKKVEAFAGQRVVAVSAGATTASPSPPTAPSGAGAMEAMASWATATSRTSCCPRRSRPLLASASSLCRLEAPQPRPHRRRRRLELGLWRLWPAGPRRRAGPAAAEEGRGLCWPARRRCVGWRRHSLALTADGAVFTWGKGDDGCLGHGEDLSNQLLPKKIEVWAQGL